MNVRGIARKLTLVPLAGWLLFSGALFAQTTASPARPEGWASRTYRELNEVKLDPSQVYRIREAAIDREDLHIRLHDGTIVFTRAVNGQITGAAFEGVGEVLLIPPDRVERWSLSVFTGAAILEERFNSAFLRFNDDTFDELKPFLRPSQDAEESVRTWEPAWDVYSRNWTLRLLQTVVNGTTMTPGGGTVYQRETGDRFFSARVLGARSGFFDLFYDSKSPEQIAAANLLEKQGTWYYDLWTSFPARSRRNAVAENSARPTTATIATQAGAEAFPVDPIHADAYRLKVRIVLPRCIQVDAHLQLHANQEGQRFLQFELSRFLQVTRATLDGNPVEFVQNEALRGTELAKRGNDNVSIVLPKALQPGEHVELQLTYAGEVLQEAGGGLMYVGAHGDWYPTRGLSMSHFDMEFRYPQDWTLVATGKRQQAESSGKAVASSEQVSRWISERPMPFAGFNLGKYEISTAKAGAVVVEAYATSGVESAIHRPEAIMVIPGRPSGLGPGHDTVIPEAPSPASHAERIAKEGASTVGFYAQRFGPYPYSSLALTQMPGRDSQSWPGLIYLSSYVFLTPEERSYARVPPLSSLMYQRLMEQHEIAHQWWGDLIIWKSYREQWIVEGLSNYCALLKLENEDPRAFREIMELYRANLLNKNETGTEVAEAGPVTLGVRLNSSRFPNAYVTISYGRGTWLFHMLRMMLLTSSPEEASSRKPGLQEEPFFRVLRRLREEYEGKEITTRELQKLFEQELPPSLHYEKRKSLDWFFDGWVNGTSIPGFTLADVKFARRENAEIVTGKIIETNATEGLVTSVPLYASGPGGDILLGRVFVEGAQTPIRFVVPHGTKKILIDPQKTVLSRP